MFRYGLPVALPVVSAAASSFATVSHGTVRVYWTLGSVTAIAGVSLLTTLKELRTRKIEALVQEHEHETKRLMREQRDDLRIVLADATRPFVTALAQLSATTDIEAKKSTMKLLIHRCLSTLRTQCGSGTRSSYRSSFYARRDGKLVRIAFEGREDTPPREIFDTEDADDTRAEDARRMLKFVTRESVWLIPDLIRESEHPMGNFGHRGYRAMLISPVRVDGRIFGFLAIDSPEADTLTTIDTQYIMLIAGVLATGLAQLHCAGWVVDRNGDFTKEEGS